MNILFNEPGLAEWLDTHTADDYDLLEFGVVKMDYAGIVTAYNKAESQLTGVSRENATGKHFFTQVGPCTNNFMVAEKYKAPILDETLPYMFTYVTKPIPVLLRLIKGTNGNQYLLARNT